MTNPVVWIRVPPPTFDLVGVVLSSLGLAGLTACTRQPIEKIVPYDKQPEEIVPGRPIFSATAMPLSGLATGLLVESHEGRPTKVEGNPDHPSSPLSVWGCLS